MSRLIKSNFSTAAEADKKVISIRVIGTGTSDAHEQPIYSHTEEERNQILKQAEHEADRMIANALAEAQSIREQVRKEQQEWEQEKVILTEDAKTIGHERGLIEGQARGYEEYRGMIQSAHEIIEASKRDYHNHIDASEKVILELGVKVAAKILGKKISENEEDFLALVKRALKNARDYKEIQLHVHPEHYSFLLAHKDELIAIFPKEIGFYIFPDDELGNDSCIIESENGRVDACVDSQLEEIKQKLFELLEGEHK
ncbi:MAG TPA: flagellar assembly protein FliH [Bacillus bacterium]|nr:flagellar assembly protein FliH [Bacillus sp. (in: firmicutes)]